MKKKASLRRNAKINYRAQSQLSKVYEAFFESPKTRKEADKACGVMRENICWYVKYLRRHNLIAIVGKRRCRVTKHLAEELTTNPALFPKKLNQLFLWWP
jgi:hypothetical protein